MKLLKKLFSQAFSLIALLSLFAISGFDAFALPDPVNKSYTQLVGETGTQTLDDAEGFGMTGGNPATGVNIGSLVMPTGITLKVKNGAGNWVTAAEVGYTGTYNKSLVPGEFLIDYAIEVNWNVLEAGTYHITWETWAPEGTSVFNFAYNVTITAIEDGSQSGPPAVAPTVATGSATVLSQTSASLSGSSSSDGGAAITAYGIHVNGGDVSGTGSSTSWSATATGLSPNTLYNYNAYATNSANRTDASSSSFTTLANPPSGAVASNIVSRGFRISWDAPSGGTSSYYIEVATNPSFSPTSFTTSTGASPYDVGGLNPYTQYYFRVRSSNAGGTEATGTSGSALTLAETPTTQSSNIYFSNVARTSITVNWTKGDGSSSMLLAKLNSQPGSSDLTDRVSYSANTDFVAANAINGSKIVYKGATPSVNVTNLTKYKLYYFKVIEYNGANGYEMYLQTTNSTNPSSRWTLRKDGEDPALNPNSAFSIYPNPTVDLINYDFELSESVNVTSELYTSDGRLVKLLNHGALFAGEQKLSLSANDLPDGVYMLQIHMGEEVLLGIVEIVK